MRLVSSRLAPLAVALVGAAVVPLLPLIDGWLTSEPNDDMLYYGATGMIAWWIFGTSCAVALGWQALRTRRWSWKAGAALVYVVIWVVCGSALAFDIAYDVIGPGIDPMPRTCFLDSRDCIGEPFPAGPVLGEGGELIFGLYTIFSAPLVLLTLIYTTFRTGGADRGRAANRDFSRGPTR